MGGEVRADLGKLKVQNLRKMAMDRKTWKIIVEQAKNHRVIARRLLRASAASRKAGKPTPPDPGILLPCSHSYFRKGAGQVLTGTVVFVLQESPGCRCWKARSATLRFLG